MNTDRLSMSPLTLKSRKEPYIGLTLTQENLIKFLIQSVYLIYAS